MIETHHHQSPLSSWSGSQCCLKILYFLSMFTWFLLMIISGAVCILSSSLLGWWPWSGSVSRPPGAWCGDQAGPPDAGTGYVTLCYSDTSPGTPGTFYHSECHWGEIMLGLRRFCEQGVSVVVRWPCSVCWWTGMDQIYWKILFSIVQFSWKWDQRSNVQSSKMLID